MANTNSLTYNVDNIVFSADGHRVRGYGEDTVISVEYNSDKSMLKTGAMGDYVWSISNDKSATITLTLLQNSISLSFLEDLANREEPFPVTLVDMNDDIIKSAPHAMIEQIGNYERGAEAGEVDVVISAGKFE